MRPQAGKMGGRLVDLSAHGVQTVRDPENTHRLMQRVSCCREHCEEECGIRQEPNAPVAAIVKAFKAKGWAERRGEWTCPRHSGRNRASDRTEATLEPPPQKRPAASVPATTAFGEPAAMASPPPAAPPLPEGDGLDYMRNALGSAPHGLRALYRLLEANLFPSGGGVAYAEGWGDDRVAAESGVDADTVRMVREDEFGRLSRDVEREALRAELDVLKAMVREFEAKLTATKE